MKTTTKLALSSMKSGKTRSLLTGIATLIEVTRLNDWNTNPILRLRNAESSFSFIEKIDCVPMMTSPQVG